MIENTESCADQKPVAPALTASKRPACSLEPPGPVATPAMTPSIPDTHRQWRPAPVQSAASLLPSTAGIVRLRPCSGRRYGCRHPDSVHSAIQVVECAVLSRIMPACVACGVTPCGYPVYVRTQPLKYMANVDILINILLYYAKNHSFLLGRPVQLYDYDIAI